MACSRKNILALISFIILLVLTDLSWANHSIVRMKINMDNRLDKQVNLDFHFWGEREIHHLSFDPGKSNQYFTVHKNYINREFLACYKGDPHCEQCSIIKYVHNPTAINVTIYKNRKCLIAESRHKL
jgi:hypothetical protein